MTTGSEKRLEIRRRNWRKHVRNWKESGLTQAEYCRRNGINRRSLFYWKKRVAQCDPEISFVEIALPPGCITPRSSVLRVLIGERYRIEIESGFDPGLLQQVVCALEGL